MKPKIENTIDDVLEEIRKRQPAAYEDKVKGSNAISLGTPFLHELVEAEQEVLDILKPFIKNKLILDLGCGIKGDGYTLSNRLEAKAYIGIESHLASWANQSIKSVNGKIPYALAQEDMGLFLKEFSKYPIKVDLIIFSGIEDTSYRGNDSFYSLFEDMEKLLLQDGKILVGGNLGWFNQDCKDIELFFKRSKIELPGVNFVLYDRTGESK